MSASRTDVPVGRRRELERISSLLPAHDHDAGHVVMVAGPAGIGKTRVLSAVQSIARDRGLTALRARGSELEQGFAFGVMRALLERPVRARGDAERAALLAGTAEAALPVLGLAPPTTIVEPTHGVLHAIYWVVAGLSAEDPLVLIVDDVQWADGPTLRALAFLAGRVPDLPVALILGRRTGEAAEPALDALAADAVRVSLELLGAADLGVMARELGVGLDAQARATCHELTGGNPLLARQLLDGLVDAGVTPDAASLREAGASPSVRAVVLQRLARLPGDARAVAGALATLGDHTDVPTIAAYLDSDDRRVLVGAADLAGAGLLGPDRLAFAHPLLAAAVVADRGAHAASLDHARAAAVVRARGAAAEVVASHLLQTAVTGQPEAVATLQAAAGAALMNGAPETAVLLLERALTEPAEPGLRHELRMLLGLARLQDQDYPAAAALLRETVDATADPLLWRARTWAVTQADGLPTAQAELLRSADDPRLADRDAVVLRAYAVLADPVDGGTAPGLALPAPEALPDEPWARPVFSALAWRAWSANAPVDRCLELAARALADEDLVAGSDPGLAAMWISPLIVQLGCGAVDDCDQSLRAFDGALRGCPPLLASVGPILHACVNLQRGDVTRALADAEVGLRIAEGDTGATRPTGVATAAMIVAEVLLATDGPAAAKTFLRDRGRWDTLVSDRPVDRASDFYARGAVRLGLGDYDGARGDLEQAHAGLAMRPAFVDVQSRVVEALVATGGIDEARAQAQAALADSRRRGAAHELAARLRAFALADPDRALAHLDEAVAQLEGAPQRLELARVLVARGARRRRENQRAAAREDLERGAELAVRCGAKPLAEQARAELIVIGARPRRLMYSGLEALTASERRVCDLAAGGLSNRAIAQELYLSVKTVESHLSAGFRKLDLSSRTELAAALAAG